MAQEQAALMKMSPSASLVQTIRALVQSLRPYQWVKNTLVFAGILFSRSLLQGNAALLSLGAFAAFCMASSAVYLVNDLRDLEEDRRHPVKRLRPLAAGLVSKRLAYAMVALLLITSLSVAASLRPALALLLCLYLTMNTAYSLGLKRVVILDVFIVGTGFVLRAVAGAIVIGVQASPWLFLCTLTLALLVSFGKRRHELVLLEGEARNHRESLAGYSSQYLDMMMSISGAAAVVTYALYTMAAETVSRFGTRALVLTTPFVLYGVFRYLFLVYQKKEGGDPTKLLVSDSSMIINVFLWIGTVCLIIYVYVRYF